MKAVKFLALLLVVVGVVASASARNYDTIELLCGSSNDPQYCDQTTGEDLACDQFCSESCAGFTNVTEACVPRIGGYKCVCHGTPQP